MEIEKLTNKYSGIFFREFPVPVYLKPFLQSLWITRIDKNPKRVISNRVLPNGTSDIIFPLIGEFLIEGKFGKQTISKAPIIIAPMTNPYLVSFHQSCLVIGARIKLGMSYHIFSTPLNTLVNSIIDLEKIVKQEEVWRASNQLSELGSIEEQKEVLFDFIRRQLESSNESIVSVDYLQALSDVVKEVKSVDQLSKRLFVSERNLQRDFRKHVGISPKMTIRILRFKDALDTLKIESNTIDWGNIYSNNYFDQSHFIRNFKRFTGLSPNNYIKESGEKDFINFYLPQFVPPEMSKIIHK